MAKSWSRVRRRKRFNKAADRAGLGARTPSERTKGAF